MTDTELEQLVRDLEDRICRKQFFYGCKSFGWATWKFQDLEIERHREYKFHREVEQLNVYAPDCIVGLTIEVNFGDGVEGMYIHQRSSKTLAVDGNTNSLRNIITWLRMVEE